MLFTIFINARYSCTYGEEWVARKEFKIILEKPPAQRCLVPQN